MQHTFIDTHDGVHEALSRLADDLLGVDVERADANNYWRSAALIQIGNRDFCALIDADALESLPQVDEHLQTREIILHALENDLAPLIASGIEPPNIHDTAIAAALLGKPIGLEPLLLDELGVELSEDKSRFQRADWSQRPLPADMLAYAAGDVHDLPELWQRLAAELDARGRFGWYEQELAATCEAALEDRRDWSRTRGAGRLDRQQRTALEHLWNERERIAQDEDLAPQRVLRDKTMIDVVTSPPDTPKELVRRNQRRKRPSIDHAEQLLDALQTGLDTDPEPVGDRGPRRDRTADRQTVDRLRKARAEIASELGLDAGVICPAKGLMTAVTSDPSDGVELAELAGLRPWQVNLLADALWDAYIADSD